MTHAAKHDIRSVCARFELTGDFASAQPYGNGHINHTYLARYSQDGRIVRYVLQRVNQHVFKHAELLMANVIRVTEHQRHKLEASGCADADRRALRLIPTRDGQAFLKDEQGDYWRVYPFVEGTRSIDVPERPRQVEEAARAFGLFQKQMVDIPGVRLHDTIPDFHNTSQRFAALVSAVDLDVHNRAISAKGEIEFALSMESVVGVLLSRHREGGIPERITHNDTKLNNVLLDETTDEGMCVIDLDTVMPGLALYDVGDMIRTSTARVAEDASHGDAQMSMPMFEALVVGYLEAMGDALTPVEKEYLAFSGKLITFEIAIRFLTDYLSGDTYFKVSRPGQNLDRCRSQLGLMRSIIRNEEAMNRFVQSRS